MKTRLFLLFWLTTAAAFAQMLPPIPTAPNQRNAASQRVGAWVETFNKLGKETYSGDSIAYYRKVTYNFEGKILSKIQEYYRNGQLRWEGRKKQVSIFEVPDSICTWYYTNGQQYKRAKFKNGKEYDTTQTWFENGKLESETPYKDGVVDGVYKTWNRNGESNRLYYEKGELFDFVNFAGEIIIDA